MLGTCATVVSSRVVVGAVTAGVGTITGDVPSVLVDSFPLGGNMIAVLVGLCIDTGGDVVVVVVVTGIVVVVVSVVVIAGEFG